MNIGDRIKHFRKIRGYTQQQLADLAQISRSYLADVEKSRYNPSLETLDKLMGALNISRNQFFHDGEDLSDEEFLSGLSEENRILFKKVKSLSKEDARKVLDIIKIFEEENRD